MAEPEEIVKAHCNQCLRETRHVVVAARRKEYNDETCDYWRVTQYEMLECCGCERITLRATENSAAEPEDVVTYFPPAVTRSVPAWLSDIRFSLKHRGLRSLFREVYAALHAGSNRLAIMGARALIDMMMLDQIGDRGTFAEKLKKMEEDGHISKTSRRFLEAAIDLGHAAAHRGHRPDDKDVIRVMDIVENLGQAIYALGPAAEALRKNTPARHHDQMPGNKQTEQ